MTLVSGMVIAAKYRLDHLLGQGGMGVVWEAEDVDTSEKVAIKFLKEAADDAQARRRFLREGRAAQAVQHPHVVKLLDVLELEDGASAIVMERLEGESLDDKLLREHRIELLELAKLLVPVVSAVGTAHSVGVVHRDLKPANIFLCRGEDGDSVAKVLDFGIAKLITLDDEAMRSTGITTGAVLGTPTYMAPEQVFGESDVDHGADIWALGLILYHCLSGILPTMAENVGQVLKNVLAKPFDPLDQLVPELPDYVARLVGRMLARERALRPADLREVLEVLGRHAGIAVPRVEPPALREKKIRRARGPDAFGETEPGAHQLGDAPTVSDPVPEPKRGRAIGAVAMAVALAGGLLVWRWEASQPSQAPVASPLAMMSAVLACPILRASGVDEPAGWLGAAAATIACERARVLLGGRPERTLVPAELLELPRGPTETFPRDPYGAPEARERSRAMAQRGAQAYLDGEVTRGAAGFTVSLALHRPDGTELRRGVGRELALYVAVRSAMAPLIGPEWIPSARVLEPEIARWARTESIADALGVLDLTFAFVQNAGGLPEECRQFEAMSGRVRELGSEGRRLCAFTLGRPVPQVVLDDADPSDAGRATRIRINHAFHALTTPGDVDDLHALFTREPTPRGRSLLAASESCLLGATQPDQARERAIVAVQSEPRNPEGGSCNPWEQLMTLERSAMNADGGVRAMQAWVPWNSYAWLEPAFRAGERDPTALPLLWRAHALSPFDAQIAGALAGGLLASGDRSAARGVAATLRKGGMPVHDVGSDLILVRVETSEAKFGAALDKARARLVIRPVDTGWIRTQRFELAWRALELAILLGRPREVADLIVERFLDPQPPVLVGNFALAPLRIPAICVYASAPGRCFARFRALRPQLAGTITGDTDELLVGAERYAQRDLIGAAKAWRTQLGGRMIVASVLPDAMVEAFEATGAADLAERVDAEVAQRAGELNGATLGHVRSARRALVRGDRGQARQLADQVIQAWSVADEPPPALADMRRLVAQLRSR